MRKSNRPIMKKNGSETTKNHDFKASNMQEEFRSGSAFDRKF